MLNTLKLIFQTVEGKKLISTKVPGKKKHKYTLFNLFEFVANTGFVDAIKPVQIQSFQNCMSFEFYLERFYHI